MTSPSVDKYIEYTSKQNTISLKEIEKIFINEILPISFDDDIKIFPNINSGIDVLHFNLFKTPSELKISKEGIDFIKHHEQLRLEAYKLGDSRITVGYGHSEPLDTTKLKVGDKISLSHANKLFAKDLYIIEQSVQRMLKRFEKDGIVLKLTQSMYDALVSVAYNTGIGGVMYNNMKTKEPSELFLSLKDGKYYDIADSIKEFKLSAKNRKYFPGLIDRRENEYNLFIKDISNRENLIAEL
jgi:GH24 family phage-related lysozyme (muramidase)